MRILPSFRVLGFLGAALAAAPLSFGADLYVDGVHGDDSNLGTSWSDAARTLQWIEDNDGAGDTVHLRGGTRLFTEGQFTFTSATYQSEVGSMTRAHGQWERPHNLLRDPYFSPRSASPEYWAMSSPSDFNVEHGSAACDTSSFPTIETQLMPVAARPTVGASLFVMVDVDIGAARGTATGNIFLESTGGFTDSDTYIWTAGSNIDEGTRQIMATYDDVGEPFKLGVGHVSGQTTRFMQSYCGVANGEWFRLDVAGRTVTGVTECGYTWLHPSYDAATGYTEIAKVTDTVGTLNTAGRSSWYQDDDGYLWVRTESGNTPAAYEMYYSYEGAQEAMASWVTSEVAEPWLWEATGSSWQVTLPDMNTGFLSNSYAPKWFNGALLRAASSATHTVYDLPKFHYMQIFEQTVVVNVGDVHPKYGEFRYPDFDNSTFGNSAGPLVLEKIHFTGGKQRNVYTNGTDDINLATCVVDPTMNQAVWISNCADARIHGNVVGGATQGWHYGRSGMRLQDSAGSQVMFNELKNCMELLFQIIGSGSTVDSGTIAWNNLRNCGFETPQFVVGPFENQEIDIDQQALETTGAQGGSLDQITGLLVHGNWIENSWGGGLANYECSDSVFTSNVIIRSGTRKSINASAYNSSYSYNHSEGAFVLWNNSHGNRVMFNTIAHAGDSIYVDPDCEHNLIANNLIYSWRQNEDPNSPGFSDDNYAIYNHASNGTTLTDNNLFWDGRDEDYIRSGSLSGSDITASWPYLRDATGIGFDLLADSPAINSASDPGDLWYDIDFEMNPVVENARDIGAYEFQLIVSDPPDYPGTGDIVETQFVAFSAGDPEAAYGIENASYPQAEGRRTVHLYRVSSAAANVYSPTIDVSGRRMATVQIYAPSYTVGERIHSGSGYFLIQFSPNEDGPWVNGIPAGATRQSINETGVYRFDTWGMRALRVLFQGVADEVYYSIIGSE